MPEFRIYGWRKEYDTSFEAMLDYAWFLYIEYKSQDVRNNAVRCLRLLKDEAKSAGISSIPVGKLTTRDLVQFKERLSERVVDQHTTQELTLYLILFLQLLEGRKLLSLNIAEIAMMR